MAFCLAAILLLLLPAGDAVAQSGRPPDLIPITTFEEPGASGSLDLAKLDESLRLTIQELRLDPRELPRIIVYHVTQETADRLDIHTNSVWRNTGRPGGGLRYEMWLVGKPSHYLYAYMFESILEQHFHLSVEASNRSKIIGHVERALDATIDVRSFH